jgi:hypothetical protein
MILEERGLSTLPRGVKGWMEERARRIRARRGGMRERMDETCRKGERPLEGIGWRAIFLEDTCSNSMSCRHVHQPVVWSAIRKRAPPESSKNQKPGI